MKGWGRAVETGSIVLTPFGARMLAQTVNLPALRSRHRVGDTAIYELLTAITLCAYSAPDAAGGILPRHGAASEERELWTVRQLARATGLSDRKVRLDCSRDLLPAVKNAGAWLIRADDANTYIAGHRTN